MKDIAIFGAGGFGREIKIIIDAIKLIYDEYCNQEFEQEIKSISSS